MYPYLYETTPRFIINGVVSYYAIPSDPPVLPTAANIRIVFTACPLSMDKVLSKAYRLVKQSYFRTRSFVCICCKNSPITGCLSAQIPFCIISCCEVGTEEMAHWEMIGTMIHQCMRNASLKEIEEAGLIGYYTMHSKGIFPADPNGVPFTTAYIQCTGDPITDIHEDMAAEQKARATYEHLMMLTDDPALLNPLRFLREREIVHFQRFGECLNILQSCTTAGMTVTVPEKDCCCEEKHMD